MDFKLACITDSARSSLMELDARSYTNITRLKFNLFELSLGVILLKDLINLLLSHIRDTG
jgi:hypothetical protein